MSRREARVASIVATAWDLARTDGIAGLSLHALARELGIRQPPCTRTSSPGVEDEGDVDCLVAMVAGLLDAQISNDPGGRRWIRHLDRLTDMYLDDVDRRRKGSR